MGPSSKLIIALLPLCLLLRSHAALAEKSSPRCTPRKPKKGTTPSSAKPTQPAPANPTPDVSASPTPTAPSSQGNPVGAEGSRARGNTPEAILAVHNAARAEVGVGPLKYNQSLADDCYKWALTKAPTCALEHSKTDWYGENLASGSVGESGEEIDLADASRLWLSEKKQCQGFSNCAHYNTCVCGRTTDIGCARVKCTQPEKEWFMMCRYWPAGDWGVNPLQC